MTIARPDSDWPDRTATDNWWALARSEDVSNKKPLAAHCGQHEIVLFRDADNQVRALEDRCPHRRAPLSLGRIRPEGGLQCGYHGWTFDGESGQCREIPNLSAGERVPPKHKVEAYPVCEREGLVYVWIGAALPNTAPASLPYVSVKRESSASLTVSLSHEQYIAALLDGPQALLKLPGMRITDHLLGDPKWRDGLWVSERGMMWAGPALPDRFVRDYPLILRISVATQTGLAVIEVCSADEHVLASAVISSVPSARGTTAVSWRSRRHCGGSWRTGLTRLLGKAPIQPLEHLDGAALAKLLVGPSRVLQAAPLIFSTAQQDAG